MIVAIYFALFPCLTVIFSFIMVMNKDMLVYCQSHNRIMAMKREKARET